MLVDRPGLAVPQLHGGAVHPGVVGRHVDALAARRRDRGAAGHRELLGRGAVAVPDLQPGAVRRGPARRVQAPPGLRVQQRTVRLLHPLLATDTVAVPQLDLRAVRRPVAVDVQAAAQRAEGAVGVVGPVLVLGVGLAVPQLNGGAVDPGVVGRHVDALAARTGDRSLRSARHVGLTGVADRDDVRLDRVLGRVGGIAGDHHTLEERAPVPVAVVAADAEDDAALLVHRLVAAARRQGAVPPRGQSTGPCVAALEGVPRLPVVLEHGGDVRAAVAAVGGVGAVVALEHAVLQVRLDPGPGAGAGREVAGGRDTDRVHVTVAGVGRCALGVAVVEAAGGAHVRAARHHVGALGLSVDGDTGGDARVAVADSGRDPHTVDLVAARGDRDLTRVRPAVRAHAGGPGRARGQVVVPCGLVVDPGDPAGRAAAEGVLAPGVRVAAGCQQADVGLRPVRGPGDLVKGAGVGGEQRAHRAVRGDARGAGTPVDVAWPGAGGVRRPGQADQGTQQEYQDGKDRSLSAHRLLLEGRDVLERADVKVEFGESHRPLRKVRTMVGHVKICCFLLI